MGRDLRQPHPAGVEHALRERVKELTCLYGIARISREPHAPLPQILQGIVDLLPDAWQYPERAQARMVVDGQAYTRGPFPAEGPGQQAGILVKGRPRGSIEVRYGGGHPGGGGSPFLPEERELLNEVARQAGLILDRFEAERASELLQAQLRHADRLATIGRFASGIAHELNEPLGSVLGFAQLAKRNEGMTPQTGEDIRKIEAAALRAREIIRKLLTFARQSPQTRTRVSLNEIVEQMAKVWQPRCEGARIRLVCDLQPDLAEIHADAAQMNQVLVNLAVNGMQAMPEGGTLTFATRGQDEGVILTVTDTGVGMEPEVLAQVFEPFFTTKDVDEGTGLGLSVVHGIVASHGGTIEARSAPGQGACFIVRLPAGTAAGARSAPGEGTC